LRHGDPEMYFRCYRNLLLRSARNGNEQLLVQHCMDQLLKGITDGVEQQALDTVVKNPTPLQCILLCMVYFAQEKYASGYEMVAKALSINPNFVPAMNILAEVRILEQDFKNAAAILERAIAHDSEQFQARHLLGEIYRTHGQFEHALRVLDPLRMKTTELPDLWIWLRECHKGLGTELLYENHLLDTTEAFPNCSVVWFYLGFHYQEVIRLDEALQAFSRANQLSPNDPSVLSNMGNVLMRTGNLEASVQYFRTATRLRSDNANAWMNLASALFLLDRKDDEFHEAIEKVAELDPAILDRATYYRLDDGVVVDSAFRGARGQ
jgi:tetratricopeptide (TPR) repeat protein